MVRALKRALQEGDKFTLARVKNLRSAQAALSQTPGFNFPFVHLKNWEIWVAVSSRLGCSGVGEKERQRVKLREGATGVSPRLGRMSLGPGLREG